MPEIPVATTNDVPGARIVRVMSPVYGTAMRSRSIVGNLLGDQRAIFGGARTGYSKMISRARDMPGRCVACPRRHNTKRCRARHQARQQPMRSRNHRMRPKGQIFLQLQSRNQAECRRRLCLAN